MKRYYVAPIIEVDDPDLGKVRQLGFPAAVQNFSAVVPEPPATWGLAIVAATDHASIRASSRLVALADFPLDGRLSALGAGVRSTMLQRLQSRFGITLDTSSTDAYRDMIRQLGRQLDPGFHEDNFDVAE